MASLTWWTWNWSWTGRPGILQSIRSQRVRHDWVTELNLVAQSCLILCDCNPPGSSVYGDSPNKNTGEGCHVLFLVIFPFQGSKPVLLHCRQIIYHLSHKGSPRTLEWVSYPFSSGSAWPRNWTQVSCVTGEFFTSWDTREKHCCIQGCLRSSFIHSPISCVKPHAGSCDLHEGKANAGISLSLLRTLGKFCYRDFLVGSKQK